jgi:hypothetical protein
LRGLHLLIVGILFLFITVGVGIANVAASPIADAGSGQTVNEEVDRSWVQEVSY